ncbi:hypothetical protein SEUCBS139899_005321 [Sporothrix eucalyptigena]
MAPWKYVFGTLCLLFGALPNCSAFTNLGQAANDLLIIKGDQIRSPNSPHVPLVVVREIDTNLTAMEMQPGSICTAEGQWNCLTTCWQRCASGIWSDTMALSPGTACTPAGLSYDMQVVGSNGVSLSSSMASETYDGFSLSTILSVTTGPCPCAASSTTSTGCSSTSSSSSSTTTPSIPNESGTSSNSGGFVSGSSTAAASGRSSGLSIVVGVGTMAVVFARLLM